MSLECSCSNGTLTLLTCCLNSTRNIEESSGTIASEPDALSLSTSEGDNDLPSWSFAIIGIVIFIASYCIFRYIWIRYKKMNRSKPLGVLHMANNSDINTSSLHALPSVSSIKSDRHLVSQSDTSDKLDYAYFMNNKPGNSILSDDATGHGSYARFDSPPLNSSARKQKNSISGRKMFKFMSGKSLSIPRGLHFLPESYFISMHDLIIDEREIIGSGHFGDVYYGKVRRHKSKTGNKRLSTFNPGQSDDISESHGHSKSSDLDYPTDEVEVACKVMKSSDYNDLSNFSDEVAINYKVGDHQNVLGLVGIYCPKRPSSRSSYLSNSEQIKLYDKFILLSPLMDRGNLYLYLKTTKGPPHNSDC